MSRLTLLDLTDGVARLSKEECVKLGNAVKARLQKLAVSPDPLVARRIRTSKTATVTVDGVSATGAVTERTALTVVLKFSDNTSLFCQLADLDSDGFDKPVTAYPDTAMPKELSSATVQKRAIKLYNGLPYQIESANAGIAEGRRLYASGLLEPLPVSKLENLPGDEPTL